MHQNVVQFMGWCFAPFKIINMSVKKRLPSIDVLFLKAQWHARIQAMHTLSYWYIILIAQMFMFRRVRV